MIKIPQNARAVAGRPIDTTIRNLERFIDSLSPAPGGGRVRLRDFWDEVSYYSPPARINFPVKFQIYHSGGEVTVTPGTLNGEVPRMGIERLDLNGIDLEGAEQSVRPRLLIDDKRELLSDQGPGKDGRSFVCLRILCEQKTGKPLIEDRPEDWLLIVHKSALPPGFESGVMTEDTAAEEGVSIGFWPLGVLYWQLKSRTVTRYLQAVNFDLKHHYYPADGDRPGAHVCF